MKILSVNVGVKSPLKVGNRQTETGIYKNSVDHPVEVKALGITGDAVLDKKHHGGPDQAVYLYRGEDYDFWTDKLGKQVAAGTFGENLTVVGLQDPALNIGDRLVFDKVELEITAPRIPCNTLAARMGDPGFAKQFVKAERPGWYARVIKEGLIQSGESFSLQAAGFPSESTVQMYRDMMSTLDAETLVKYLDLPIDERTRRDFDARLKKLAG